ncbi:MAG: cobalamin biosynthesis protein [Microcoleus sp. PH2017_10_PVI_O_A]|uniref:cobalamin biosynthesis protein n=1 Tax=unclassified Microcoleus TaxID=2642155 RepID=UPI001D1E4B40|nr:MULTISPECIES: cobalamin biosynthesis protein [unclassified Microcoleus]TAE80679.1 MAG: cobalamin biosynthesis protein CbiG [Oscillatoriales cyanobacterium]MCC3407474.1 cobalamin biosynthesis protein [Microcoleus sp. PH2017_10_PVI_O_A]MCC3461534.1 cobalamin biosynthesis protein [Microcoleus sp. PH2017_11_PCY_U_A]MCC3480029.1 cobalamin biosynthesis protein [Microcoleus sp. PH2017_12_PCY_D_A]MCC3529880.1 cobalamin biosynthesis protein [Microcoleus sp. PH2017_21_RUC_O_A]
MSDEFTLDRLDIPSSWNRGEGDWTGVGAAMKRGETVEVIQEVGSILWRNSLPEKHSLYWEGENLSPIKGRIWISFTQRRFAPESALPKVQWHPRVLWVGIGCNAGTSRELIETAIQSVCRAYHLAEGAIAGIATIDTKASEIGLLELCQARNWPLKTFAADVLSSVEVPNSSNIVAQEVGTPSVAEAGALCAIAQIVTAHQQQKTQISINHPRLFAFICGSHPLLVPKKVFRSEKMLGSVTVAVAVCPIDYLG